MNERNEHLDGEPHPSTSGGEPSVAVDAPGPEQGPDPTTPDVDLDAVGHDLDGVDAALERLDDGTYWTDETTGAEIPDDVLADDPTARRAT